MRWVFTEFRVKQRQFSTVDQMTKASTDPNDLEALTPNYLLLLKTTPSLPPGQFDKDDIYARRRWRQIQYMSDLFWKSWIK